MKLIILMKLQDSGFVTQKMKLVEECMRLKMRTQFLFWVSCALCRLGRKRNKSFSLVLKRRNICDFGVLVTLGKELEGTPGHLSQLAKLSPSKESSEFWESQEI